MELVFFIIEERGINLISRCDLVIKEVISRI